MTKQPTYKKFTSHVYCSSIFFYKLKQELTIAQLNSFFFRLHSLNFSRNKQCIKPQPTKTFFLIKKKHTKFNKEKLLQNTIDYSNINSYNHFSQCQKQPN